MSSNLYWEPVKSYSTKNGLSTALKFALRKSWGEPVNCIMTRENLGYLNGLADAGIEDAKELIDAIEAHNEIEVKEVY